MIARLLRGGSSLLVLVCLMFSASLVMWVGIPIGSLWVGAQVQAYTDSVGAAVGAALIAVLLCLGAMIPVLGWLSNRHRALRHARGREDLGHVVLEAVMVTSATVAVALFAVWFLFFAGSSPIPVSVSA